MTKVTNIVILNRKTFILDLIVKSKIDNSEYANYETLSIDCFASVFKTGMYKPR